MSFTSGIFREQMAEQLYGRVPLGVLDVQQDVAQHIQFTGEHA